MSRELDALLDGIGGHLAASAEVATAATGPVPASGRVYRAITRYWPRIAAALVGAGVVLDFVLGNIAAGTTLEFYVFAWASTTGGLWFLFEKAEKTLSEESRAKVVGWLQEADLEATISSVPAQFAVLFDKVFGEKHWSRRCFNRSCVASLFSFVVVLLAMSPSMPTEFMYGGESQGRALLIGMLAAAVPFNFLPDYLSLLETRWCIRVMERTKRVWGMLVLDLIATGIVAMLGIFVMSISLVALAELVLVIVGTPSGATLATMLGDMLAGLADREGNASVIFMIPVSILSAYFTSVWLWLYVGAVYASRALLRMNEGVGFLLRATDVERQPFRSMGFVSVMIASAAFALGLPLVLL